MDNSVGQLGTQDVQKVRLPDGADASPEIVTAVVKNGDSSSSIKIQL